MEARTTLAFMGLQHFGDELSLPIRFLLGEILEVVGIWSISVSGIGLEEVIGDGHLLSCLIGVESVGVIKPVEERSYPVNLVAEILLIVKFSFQIRPFRQKDSTLDGKGVLPFEHICHTVEG